MPNPVFLKTENELNKLLKSHKRSSAVLKILFVSSWDKWCCELVDRITSKAQDSGKPLYIVDSFLMPHAFVIFNTTKLPHLVTVKKDKVRSQDYLPLVYKDLGF
jgi:hypothetical protein